jgi:hypothetical protein
MSAALAIKHKSTPKPRHAMRVVKGGFAPADASTKAVLRSKGYRAGDLVFVEITKPRNPLFHRLVHRFGTLVANNTDAFAGLNAHQVLKRIQIEGDIGCDHTALNFPGVGPVIYRVPRSLAFESMDDGEFSEIYRAFARYVSDTYWPSLTPEEIQTMARDMPEEV